MQNIQKRKKQYFKDFLFKRVNFVPSIKTIFTAIILLNVLCDGLVILQYVIEDQKSFRNFNNQYMFYMLIVLLALFFIITLVSIFNKVFRHIWMYYLMFIESLTIFYIRNTVLCITSVSSEFCQNQLSIKITNVAVLLILCLVIIIFKNNAYYPFQNVKHIFSTRQENISVFLLVFRIFLGLIIYHDFFNDRSKKIKLILILSFVLFWKSRSSGYLHRFSKKLWDIYFYFISWTSLSMFMGQYLNSINDSLSLKLLNTQQSFMVRTVYFFIYTFPFVICIPLCFGGYIGQQFWKNVFLLNKNEIQQVYQKDHIIVICNQLYQVISQIKKSQMKFKDPLYKQLLNLIQIHNSNCVNLRCPLFQQQQKETKDNDDEYFLQWKFTKTLNNTLQFTRNIIQRLREKNSTNIQVQIQIAYFYLISLENKQKAMILFNEYYSKKNKRLQLQKQSNYKSQQSSSKSEKSKKETGEVTQGSQQLAFNYKYGIYFLKKKTDSMFSGQLKQNEGNIDNQISQFRQNIQISVTMLTQFWSVLADSKCNLKKLYEVTNLLYPLRLNIDENWQKIKLFKNVQTYCIYAKYLVKMFNDKQRGVKIMDEAKKIQYQLKNKQQFQFQDKGRQIVEQNGIIFMQYDGKNSGFMFQANINASKMFGYPRDQLVNRKVNQIMPKIYAKNHDRILQNYLQTNYSTMMNKQRCVWAKSKDGFIFPIIITIKPILSYFSKASNTQVYANIKRQPYLRQVVGIIINKDEIVQEYTTTALRVFPSLKRRNESKMKGKLKHKKSEDPQNNQKEKILPDIFSISDLIPEYQKIKMRLQSENQPYEYRIQRKVKIGHHNSKQKEQVFTEICTYNVQISQIVIKITGKIGYFIKLTKFGNSQYTKREPNQNNLEVVQNHKGIHLNQSKFKVNSKNQAKSQNQGENFLGQNQFDGKRKFIFSYDTIEKQQTFQNSLKQIRESQNQINENLNSKGKDVNANNVLIPKLNNKQNSNKCDQKQLIQNSTALMKYLGGYTQCVQILDKIRLQTLSNFKNQIKVSEMQYEQKKVDYSIGIKTKRLTQNTLRQLRQQSEYEFKMNNQNQDLNQQSSKEMFSQIRPSQLSTILSKTYRNRQILYLRLITMFLLISSSIISIVEFVVVKNHKQMLLKQMSSVKDLCEIKTEVYSLNYFVNYFGLYKGDQNLLVFQNMHHSIDELDQRLNTYQFKRNCEIVYSDGTKQSYFLGFSLNKLISSINVLQLNDQKLFDLSQPGAFFVRYNSINGISVGLLEQQNLHWVQYSSIITRINRLCTIFIASSSSLYFVLMVVKNILLKMVAFKKEQILEIFFQIPRVTCNIIQKQCQLFILRITSDTEYEQAELTSSQQFEDGSRNEQKSQKKRTIVGQQNNVMLFIVSCFFLLIGLLIYQLYFQIVYEIKKQNYEKIGIFTRNLFSLQYKLFQLPTFTESYIIDKSIPVLNSFDQIKTLDELEKQLEKDVSLVGQNFFKILKQLDEQYVKLASEMYYQDLCTQQEKCKMESSALVDEHNQGLNSVISKYLQVVKTRYKEFVVQLSSSQGFISSQQWFTKVKVYQKAMKYFWRQFTTLLQKSVQRQINNFKIINLWSVVGICILNLVVLMIVWLKYYSNLQQKILATEYMLTFIPIDEINKNKKIAKFIKSEVLKRNEQ